MQPVSPKTEKHFLFLIWIALCNTSEQLRFICIACGGGIKTTFQKA